MACGVAMNIVVCIKQVPDTAAQIKINAEGKSIDRSNLNYVLNPYEEYAVEEALRIKEKFGGEVVLITIGPKRAEDALRTALAMGADRALHICDERIAGSDHLGLAKILAKVIGEMKFDVVLCGKLAVDDNSAQVGARLAELLNIPQVTAIAQLEIEQDGKVKAHREVEGAKEVIETRLPALFTAEKDLNKPRYPSLPGIMKARTKEVKLLTLDDIGIDPKEVGLSGAKTHIVEMTLPPSKKGGRILEGEMEKVVLELATLLHKDVKII